jgi:hypothetical protein
MDSPPWVTLVSAWPQGDEKSGLVIRMFHSFGPHTEDRSVASIGDAIAQLRKWLEEIEGLPVQKPFEQ